MKKVISRIILSFVFCMLLGGQIAAQQAAMIAIPDVEEKKEVVKRPRSVKNADDFYLAKEYSEAIEHFKKAYSKVKTREEKAEIAHRLAECYKFTFNYRSAEAQYKRSIKLKQGIVDNYLGVAEMLKYQMKILKIF